jgi:hypothetical protein
MILAFNLRNDLVAVAQFNFLPPLLAHLNTT